MLGVVRLTDLQRYLDEIGNEKNCEWDIDPIDIYGGYALPFSSQSLINYLTLCYAEGDEIYLIHQDGEYARFNEEYDNLDMRADNERRAVINRFTHRIENCNDFTKYLEYDNSLIVSRAC